MGHAYNKYIASAPERQAELDIQLASYTSSSDIVINYLDIACTFPSSKPHPDSFEIPLLDQVALEAWSKERNYQVAFVGNKKTMRDVLFSKLT